MFRRKSKTPRVDLADFLKHLADQYSCESPYELGIRIQSLGLPISVRFGVTTPLSEVYDSVLKVQLQSSKH